MGWKQTVSRENQDCQNLYLDNGHSTMHKACRYGRPVDAKGHVLTIPVLKNVNTHFSIRRPLSDTQVSSLDE